MSSSPSRAPTRPALKADLLPDPQPFPYHAIAAEAFPDISGRVSGPSEPAVDQGAREAATREAQIREQGRQQGIAEFCKTFEDRLSEERRVIVEALSQFANDRSAYFQKVEAEVVHLSLAIARKILHREAQVDPLLLAGIVRVALEKIAGATAVVLRLNPQIAPEWQKFLTAQLKPSDRPNIIEDAAQPSGHCALETSMGTTEIGVELQLKEIEQGLMDLMAARPTAHQGRVS
ncbi:MAG TPA: FliH/SctL family protein [Candidatus Sulfotelmatobacter sp.]|nr:FliH/SctL family protein [Candidatus Sulfotelmatobacter sp.]